MTQWGLDNLFNPGKRHMDDEKRRLQSTREEIGDSSGGRRIDLEAGTVSISVPRSGNAPGDADPDETALEPALEAEDVPAVALGNDEAEIEPEVVDDDGDQPEPVAPAAGTEAVFAGPVPAAADDVPIEAPAPEPVVAAPRRRAVSANAWSRRG